MAKVHDLLMPPLAHGQVVLLCSGGETVARLLYEQADQPWIEYRFRPSPAWFELGPATAAFSGSARQGLTGIDARVRAIEDLDLTLRSEDGSIEVRDFLLHVRREKALIRSSPRGLMPSMVLLGAG